MTSPEQSDRRDDGPSEMKAPEPESGTVSGISVTRPTTILTITPQGRIVPGDGLVMDDAAAAFLHSASAYVAGLEAERDALRAAGNALAEAIEAGLGYAPMKAAADRWRARAGEGAGR